MIKVSRVPAPPSLATNGQTWSQEYCQALDAWITAGKPRGKKPKAEKYKQDDVREELERLFIGKCGYCESKVKVTQSYTEIEHYRPKAGYCKDSHKWENLLLSCSACNKKKSDNFPTDFPILNPYDDDPESFFSYLLITQQGRVIIEAGDKRAENTITLCNLNRDELCEQRALFLIAARSLKKNIESGDASEPWQFHYDEAVTIGQYVGMLRDDEKKSIRQI